CCSFFVIIVLLLVAPLVRVAILSITFLVATRPFKNDQPPGSMMMDGSPTPVVKTRLCNKYNTAKGCKRGTNATLPTGYFVPPPMANPGLATLTRFSASATTKINVDASFAGSIIGRGGANTKQISF
ncbi:hypothetical protein ACJX0J_034910, partial [Zea mays]